MNPSATNPTTCRFCGGALGTADVHTGTCTACSVRLSRGSDTIVMPASEKDAWWSRPLPGSARGGDEEGKYASVLNRLSIKSHHLTGHDDTMPDTGADFDMVRQIGSGGMGVIYEARQNSIDRTIALKMIKPGMVDNIDIHKKFLSEAVVTGDLDHPNIVPIHELGENGQGIPFFTMKLVRGKPWKQVIRQNSLADNLEVLLRTADAVAYAHSREILHRDLKPDNVMLGDFGEVLLMDWGLAVSLVKNGKAESISTATAMDGTPAYMAPELASGDVTRIGPGSDIYLLGAILFEIITGEPPHAGDTAEATLRNAAHNVICQTADTSELMDIAMKAMATEPADRYQSVKDLQTAIRQYRSHTESIALATAAHLSLNRARETNSYHDYSAAMFGCAQALQLWVSNKDALRTELTTRLAYARCALDNGDLDLANSLVDSDMAEARPLVRQIQEAKTIRDSHERKQLVLQRAAVTLVATIIIILSVSFFWIRNTKLEAVKGWVESEHQTALAVEARRDADKKTEQAEAAALSEIKMRRLAEEKSKIADIERRRSKFETQKALAARNAEDLERERANSAAREAELARMSMVLQQKKAEISEARARMAERQNEEIRYVTMLMRARSSINERDFAAANRTLDKSPEHLRNWEWGRLKRLCDLDIKPLTRDGDAVDVTAMVSDGGGAIITVSKAGSVSTWNLATGKAVTSIKTKFKAPRFVVSVNDGKQIIFVSRRGVVDVIDAATGKVIHHADGPDKDIAHAVFSHDGSYGLLVGRDGHGLVIKTETGDMTALTGLQTDITAAGSVPQRSALFVTGDNSGMMQLWDARTADLVRRYPGHEAAIQSIVFSSAGKHIVSGDADGIARIWRLRDAEGYLVKVKVVAPHGKGDVWPNTHKVGTRNIDVPGDVTVDPAPSDRTGIHLEERYILKGHSRGVASAAFTADGSRLITGSLDGSVKLWDTHTGKNLIAIMSRHRNPVTRVAFFADNDHVLIGRRNGVMSCWDTLNMIEISTYKGSTDSEPAFLVAAVGDAVLTRDRGDAHAVLWRPMKNRAAQILHKLPAPVAAADISLDARFLAVGDRAGSVIIWDIQAAARHKTLTCHDGPVDAVTFDHKTGQLFTASFSTNSLRSWGLGNGTIPIISIPMPWGLDGGPLVKEQNPNPPAVPKRMKKQWLNYVMIRGSGRPDKGGLAAAVYSPDQRKILMVSHENTVKLWDTVDRHELMTFRGHTDVVVTVAFSPDGRRVLTGSRDKTLKIWNTETGMELMTLDVHNAPIIYSAFSNDGKYIISASEDDTAILWFASDWRKK